MATGSGEKFLPVYRALTESITHLRHAPQGYGTMSPAGELPFMHLRYALDCLTGLPTMVYDGPFLSFNMDACECRHKVLPFISEVCREFRRKNISLICEMTEKEPWLFDVGQRHFLKQLTDAGCELALDDFGSGFSHPNLVTESGAGYIKIAGSVISQISYDPRSHAYSEALIYMARKTGMRVIAEGVETHYQRIWLIKHGVELFQGFYFSPPLHSLHFWGNA